MENLIDIVSSSIKDRLYIVGYNVSIDSIKIVLLFIFCSGFFPALVKFIRQLISWIENKKAQNDLFPLIEKSVVKEATKYYVATNFQNISPGDEHEPSYAHASTAKSSLMPFFLKKAFIDEENPNKYYLILADSGMGKSTFLINLFIRYQRSIFRKYKISLIPLGNPQADNEWQKFDSNQQKATILLLDGFDEDPVAGKNYQERLESILRQTRGFRAVVLTSRTQFFPSEKEEPYKTGVYRYSLNSDTSHYFKKMYISPFDNDDVSKYLNKKYPRWNILNINKRSQAKQLIELSPNLIVRPMLLSYIDDLILPYNFSNINNLRSKSIYLTSVDVYSRLINKWIMREAYRVPVERREDFVKDMYIFSEKTALDIFHRRTYREGLYIYSEDLSTLAIKHSINLSELELKGRSLLNRDSFGRYKFAHKSILEFLLAKHAIDNSNFAEGVGYFINFTEFDLAQKFYQELLTQKVI